MSRLFELVAVCPEVEAGLTIPRPPVQLTGSIASPRMTGRDDPSLDITDLMHRYCEKRIAQLDSLSGFIFKSRSPSCGLNSVPVFIDGACVTEHNSGAFAGALSKRYPGLAVIEETELTHKHRLDNFIRAVTDNHQQLQMLPGNARD